MYTLHMNIAARDACKPNPCQNNGICRTSSHGFICNCRGNYGGTKCQCKYCLIPVHIWNIFSLNMGNGVICYIKTNS